ncbi:hypothetical protein D3C76_716650 [compost metagenome]
MRQCNTLLRRTLQQCRQVDDQQQAVERALASIAQQPCQQVLPQSARGARRHGRIGLFRVLGQRARRCLLADESAGGVDDHRIIADPPAYRVGKRLRLSALCLGLVDAGQGETLIGALNEAGFAGVIVAQHQIPG